MGLENLFGRGVRVIVEKCKGVTPDQLLQHSDHLLERASNLRGMGKDVSSRRGRLADRSTDYLIAALTKRNSRG